MQAKAQRADEQRKLLEDLAAGKAPTVARALDEAEEAEEEPTLQFEVARHKVKLIIGAGGERIKQIQRRTKTRIQVRSPPGGTALLVPDLHEIIQPAFVAWHCSAKCVDAG